jgi:hypothetical protein
MEIKYTQITKVVTNTEAIMNPLIANYNLQGFAASIINVSATKAIILFTKVEAI